MRAYPFISVIFLGDNSIEEIDLSLKALKEINYPQDQLEFYLIVPYHRPLSEFAKNYSRLRIIRFDETIQWYPLNAQLEGLSFAKGEYVQLFRCNYSIHSSWLKTGLEYLENQKNVSVTSDADLKFYDNSSRLVDGLYDLKILKQIINNFEVNLTQSDNFQDSNNMLHVSEPMVDFRKMCQKQVSQNHLFNNRLRSILSKYVLVK